MTTARIAKPQADEQSISQAKTAALAAKRRYMTCRPSKEEAEMAAFLRWREVLMAACGSDYNRFAAEWRDVMESR